MKSTWIIGMAACFGLLIGGLVGTGRGAAPAPNREAFLDADRAFDAATAARGLDGFSSFLADDVQTLRADKPVVSGKAAMQAEWKPLLENKKVALRWHPISAEMSKSGDLAYTVGEYKLTQTDEKGSRVAGTGKYLTIWRLQKDGSIKVVFDTGTPDSDPAPAKP